MPGLTKYISKEPSIKLNQKSLYFSLISICAPTLTMLLSITFRQLFDKQSLEGREGIHRLVISPGMLGVTLSLLFSSFAFYFGLLSFKSGDRSFKMFLGLILSIILLSFWIFMILGEILSPH